MSDYLNFTLYAVTKDSPWERVEYDFFTFGVRVAYAKVPPPFVNVTPKILENWDNDPSYRMESIHDVNHLIGQEEKG